MKNRNSNLRTAIMLSAGLLGLSQISCSKQDGIQARVVDCSGDKFKFDDVDSLFCGKEYIRILGIDGPETMHKEHGIFENQPYGIEAANYARDIFGKAHSITAVVTEKDKYGRSLGHVFVNGQLYGELAIRAGFAYETISKYGDNGFPGFALAIKTAWKETWKDGKLPLFENPSDWRKKHQKKVE